MGATFSGRPPHDAHGDEIRVPPDSAQQGAPGSPVGEARGRWAAQAMFPTGSAEKMAPRKTPK